MNTLQLQFLMLIFAGWVNRNQQDVIEYLQEENRVLREQLGEKCLLFTDGQRGRRAGISPLKISQSRVAQLIGPIVTNISPILEPREEALEHRMLDWTRAFIELQISFGYVRRVHRLIN